MEPEIPILPGRERRSELRRICNNAAVELTRVECATASVTTTSATIVDVSRSGLRLIASNRLSCGEQVRIKMEKYIIFGEVRHCRAQGAMFTSGIQISNVVGHQGLCDRLTEEQIELLVLGRGLSAAERMYAHFHVSHCECCEEYLRVTQEFFAPIGAPATSESSPHIRQD